MLLWRAYEALLHSGHRHFGHRPSRGESGRPAGLAIAHPGQRPRSRAASARPLPSSCHRMSISPWPADDDGDQACARPRLAQPGEPPSPSSTDYTSGQRCRSWPDQPRIRRPVRPAAPDHPGRKSRGSPRRRRPTRAASRHRRRRGHTRNHPWGASRLPGPITRSSTRRPRRWYRAGQPPVGASRRRRNASGPEGPGSRQAAVGVTPSTDPPFKRRQASNEHRLTLRYYLPARGTSNKVHSSIGFARRLHGGHIPRHVQRVRRRWVADGRAWTAPRRSPRSGQRREPSRRICRARTSFDAEAHPELSFRSNAITPRPGSDRVHDRRRDHNQGPHRDRRDPAARSRIRSPTPYGGERFGLALQTVVDRDTVRCQPGTTRLPSGEPAPLPTR